MTTNIQIKIKLSLEIMNSPSQRIFSVQFDFPYKYISDTVIGLEGFELYLEEHIIHW